MSNIGALNTWSTTEASNQPDTTDQFTITGDLRAIQVAMRNELATQDTIASATTTDLGSKNAGSLTVTGTTTITGLGTVSAGIRRRVVFSGALTLTHNATSLILPGGANITTAANDRAEFESLGSGNWRCNYYVKADGTAVAVAATAPFADTTSIIKGSADATKLVRFEVDGLTTGTTRVMTVPDADLTIVGTATTQTLTNKSVDLASNTLTGTKAQFDTACSDDNFGYLGTAQTFTQLQSFSAGTQVTGAVSSGYGTGAGGTVTQSTNKSTAVTLNKPTGQITMNNASLSAGASVTFTFNNSFLSSTDVLVLTQSSALSTNYSVRSNITAGACVITVKNESAGPLSDALVINFAIIKGAAS